MTAIQTGTPRASKRALVSAVRGLLLAAATIAGVGAWRSSVSERAATVVVVPAAVAQSRAPAVVASQPALTVFVVGSADELALLHRFLSIADTANVTPPPDNFVLDGSIADADAIIQAIQADASIARPDGQAQVQVLDLRRR